MAAPAPTNAEKLAAVRAELEAFGPKRSKYDDPRFRKLIREGARLSKLVRRFG